MAHLYLFILNSTVENPGFFDSKPFFLIPDICTFILLHVEPTKNREALLEFQRTLWSREYRTEDDSFL